MPINQAEKIAKQELKSTELGKNLLEKVTPKKELNKLIKQTIVS